MTADTLLYTTKHALNVMNLKNGAITTTIPFETGSSPVEPVFIDSEHILAIRSDRYITLINTKTATIKQQSHCPEPIKSLILSHSKTYLFAGTSSGKLYTWHFPSGELISVIDAHYKAISTIQLNDDDSLVFTAGFDGSCHIWDLYTLLDSTPSTTTASNGNQFIPSTRPTPRSKYSAHSMPITSMFLTPSVGNGGKFFTSSLDRHIIEYSLESKEIRNIWSLPSPVLKLTTNPTFTELYAGCANGMIYSVSLYDESGFALSPTGNALDKTISHISTTSVTIGANKPKTQFKTFTAHTGLITGVFCTIQGTHMISTSSDGSVVVWSVPQRQPIQQYVASPQSPIPIINAVMVHDTHASLRIHDDLLRKKQFAQLSRDLQMTRPLTQYIAPQDKGFALQSLAFVPQITNTFSFTQLDAAQDYYESHLLALVDSDANISQNLININNNKNTNVGKNNNNNYNQMHDDVEEEQQESTEEIAKKLSEKEQEIKKLEAEVKKWKGVATEMYKKQKK